MDIKLPRWKRREFTRNAVLAGLGLAGISAAGCATTTTTAPTTTAATTTAVPTTTAVTGGTLTGSIMTEPASLNPLLEKKFGHHILTSICDKVALWDYTDEGIDIVPSAARSIEFNTDYTQLVIELDDSVTFTNGHKLCADDLIYFVEVRLNEQLAIDTLGVVEITQVAGQNWFPAYDVQLPITKVDEQTVQFDLGTPGQSFVEMLAGPEANLVPKNYLIANIDDYGINPVGSGAFKFKEWVAADHITIERNDDWWAGSAYLDEVVIKITPEQATRVTEIQAGVTDIMSEVTVDSYAQLSADANINILGAPIFDQVSITFHYVAGAEGYPQNDKRFREAVAYCLDWPGYLQGLYPELYNDGQVEPNYGYLAKSWAYDPNMEQDWPYDYDMNEAQSLIDELQAESAIPTLTLVTRSDKSDVTEYLVTQLQSMGLTVDHVILDIPSYVGRIVFDKNYDITIWNIRSDSFDPHLRTRNQFHSDRSFFDNDYDDPDYDALIDQAKASGDQSERTDLYRQLEQLAIDDLWWVPTYSINNIHAYRNNVQDYNVQQIYTLAASKLNNTWKG